MTEFIRPISRLTAVELTDCEQDSVGGGFFEAACLGTDYYTNKSKDGNKWEYDGSKCD